jgi:predicted NUDIX family NTP pyrophosphohydrolase
MSRKSGLRFSGKDMRLAKRLPVQSNRKAHWRCCIPKGLIESGADPLATAQREFTEETGFVAQGPFVKLTPVKQKSGKLVHAFACEGDFDPDKLVSNKFQIEWPPRSKRMKSFPEIDRAGWFGLTAAREKIIPYQLPLLAELESKLHHQD